MTKRFTIIDDYTIEYDGDYFDLHKPSDIRSLVRVIGYVADENEQLQEQRAELFIRERDTKNEWRELKQENESLKEENKFLRNKVATYKSGNALLKKSMDKEWK